MRGHLGAVNRQHVTFCRKRFDRLPCPAYQAPPLFLKHMGKQYNKVEKRRRRQDYAKRKKDKAKAARSASKAKPKKAPARKKEAPAPAAE